MDSIHEVKVICMTLIMKSFKIEATSAKTFLHFHIAYSLIKNCAKYQNISDNIPSHIIVCVSSFLLAPTPNAAK